ncbi:unnamed protein product [Phytomonas sp. EM1]|nr:unnamed protein product [Phytomonas sp. EM1]|eukprot:CCW64846.1 unnamed protein product [Phytomonas sp. isolate EM1]
MRDTHCMDLGGDGGERGGSEALAARIAGPPAAASATPPAVWCVSTAKHGNGVTNLLSWGNFHTYWQSDGVLPHCIRVDFAALLAVEAVLLLLSHACDESYTPRVVTIRAGCGAADMMEVGRGVFESPEGWGCIDLGEEEEEAEKAKDPDPGNGRVARGGDLASRGVWCTRLEIIIVENRDNGRDCHVRGVRILGPCQEPACTYPASTRNLLLR